MIERVINMKKKKKYVFETIKILILIFVAFYILSSTIEVKKSVFDGLQRCIQTIIPSLYAVMALSGITTSLFLISRYINVDTIKVNMIIIFFIKNITLSFKL